MADQEKPPVQHVAIIGAGFSGTLQAINLLRHDGPHATLIERREDAARGVAYSAAHPDHLLNVRAGNMSALPDDAGHFARWLEQRHPQLSGFVPRIIYGDYLSELLADAQARAPERLTLVRGEAVAVQSGQQRMRVKLSDGAAIDADTVILASGNLPPDAPPGLAAAGLDADRYVQDPWGKDIADGLGPEDSVLVIGAGLTMVDVVLLLEARRFKGRIIAISRRGLVPLAHEDGTMKAGSLCERPRGSPAALVRTIRRHAEAVGWRAAVDALRPFTQDMWSAASLTDRARFLRHLKPYWDIHRHRLAPAVATKIAALRSSGRLEIRAGKLQGVCPTSDGVRVTFRDRGATTATHIEVRRIVNCSGPQSDLARTHDTLLRNMTGAGLIRPGPLRLGIDVNLQAEVIGADGWPNPRLLALGPMTRGAFWEIVAVPDIRIQTWSVARRLSNAHWVEGEGL